MPPASCSRRRCSPSIGRYRAHTAATCGSGTRFVMEWKIKCEDGESTTRALFLERLTRWRVDKALAGLREPDAPADLDPSERDDCLALWREVTALIDPSEDGKP